MISVFFFPDCPLWYEDIFKDLEGKDLWEVILKPAAMFENPFFKSPHKIVFCEIWITKDEPAGNFNAYTSITLCRIIML